MDVSTIFLLSNGWGHNHKTIEKLEYEKFMKKAKWKEKEEIDPDMPNRGASFVKIMEYVAEGGE